MAIEVTARHMNAGDRIQEYARSKAEEIVAAFPKVEHIHVILDVEKHRQMAEVVVQAKNHFRAEAAESSDNLATSVDGAMAKIEKQLRRLWDKIHDHKPAMKRGEQERQRGVAG